MIDKNTLEGVKIGILNDEQLDKAIKHYSNLEESLKCHGEVYHLVWKDVYMNLMTLKSYKESRSRNKKQ